ncbi:MAG: M48 family metallopeptidase [Pseudolabrys sp.]
MSDTSQAATTGAGTFFDGRVSTRRDVRVTLGARTLIIDDADDRRLAEWPYEEIEGLPAPDGVLRLGRHGQALLERLTIADPAFAAAVDARAANVDRSGGLQHRQRLAVVGLSVTAVATLLVVAWFGVPAVAGRVAPLLPVAVERKLGAAVDLQIRSTLDSKHAGAAFECGNEPGKADARAAFVKVTQRLEAAASLPQPLHFTIVHRSEANAFAIPGGQVYVFEGLIDAAHDADELAGVLAHEIGHVAHRDGTRAVLQGAGLSFLFGMVLGDFVGGGAVVMAAKTVLQSSYSRDVEAAADVYGVGLMQQVGGNGRSLAAILARIGGATEPGMKILRDHPDTKARIATIERLAPGGGEPAMLAPAEWTALRGICKG